MTSCALYRWLRSTAERRADHPAFTFSNGSFPSHYTFAELFGRVDGIASRFTASGIDRGGPVGLLLKNQEDQVLHYLAALAVGAVPAVLAPSNRKLNHRYYLDTMAAVVKRSQFSAIVTDVEGLRVAPPTFAPHDFEPLAEASSAQPPDGTVLQSRVPFLQYSSGTTGFKRGVVVPDEAVTAQLHVYGQTLQLSPDDRIVSWLPLYHDMGFIACLNMPLVYGLHCVMLDPIDWVTDPVRFLRAASEHRATLSWNPNFAYAFMAQRIRDDDLDGIDLSSLRGLVNCSEPVTFESQQQFMRRFSSLGLRPDVFKGCYAMAETTFALTHGEPEDPCFLDELGPVDGAARTARDIHVSVGRPLPGVDMIVVDDAGAALPDRQVGEIWVRSPFNFLGYHNDPEATDAAFVDGWYRTGDLGYRVGDAYYVVGRKKDVLIVGGVNVLPQDIEDLVAQVDGIVPGRVAAFSDFDPRLQTERIVVLAESHATDSQAQQIVVEARQRLLAALQIANFAVQLVPPGWLVKSSSGKMARGQNREKWNLTGGSGGMGVHARPAVAVAPQRPGGSS